MNDGVDHEQKEKKEGRKDEKESGNRDEKENRKKDTKENKIKQIEMILDRIQSIREGAFMPIFQQPWVRAVLLLIGGGGSLAFLEAFV